MKKFKFKIHGNEYQVEIKDYEDDVAEIDVNGSVYRVEVHKEQKSIKTPKLLRSTTIAAQEEGDKARTAKPSEKKGGGSIKAPLPGIILEIKVNAGDKVKIGDRLLIMEAMKMENNINTDKEGVVKTIHVKEGDSVLEGDVLIEIESQ
jgi:glutaconyl-CoA/methylmalonyl-CoA decarboxylase subunit gamma